MDIFDQHLFEELTAEYAKTNLSYDDYEELYMRFCNIDYMNEVRPYLLVMCFFGLGTASEKDTVLDELKTSLGTDDFMIKGLYYDLLLSLNENNTDAVMNLRQMIDEGYTNIYTKERTSVEKVIKSKNHSSKEDSLNYIKINSGYISDWMNTTSDSKIILQNPYLLLIDYEISSIFDILHLIEPIAPEKVPLLIIAKDVNGEALETLKINCQAQALYSVSVKFPAIPESEIFDMLNNIAAHCHATVISEKMNVSLESANATMLGRAAFVTIDKDRTIIAINPKRLDNSQESRQEKK